MDPAIFAAATAAAAAAEEQRRREEEEWPEAGPPSAGANDWQYKIVRGRFTSREAMEDLQREQAEWGWRLVEVLDPNRIRFGRPAAVAAKDVAREGNPYATTSRVGGLSPCARQGVVLACLLMAAAGLGFTLLIGSWRMASPVPPPPPAAEVMIQPTPTPGPMTTAPARVIPR
jgi:hypothetical protein